MKILKYTPEIQKQFNSKVEAKPWMHCAVFNSRRHNGVFLLVYVWDTRDTVEHKFLDGKSENDIKGEDAIDNHKPLQVRGQDLPKIVNAYFRSLKQ